MLVVFVPAALTQDEQFVLSRVPELKLPESYKGPNAPLLPYWIDNSTQPFFRPITSQSEAVQMQLEMLLGMALLSLLRPSLSPVFSPGPTTSDKKKHPGWLVPFRFPTCTHEFAPRPALGAVPCCR